MTDPRRPTSLIVFPFKQEEVSVVASNLRIASAHESTAEVWAVAAAEDAAMAAVQSAAEDIHEGPIRVFAQERLGSLRSGKGDGMNTAIARAAESGFERVHFYDADITNFDRSWIDGAEAAADGGYQVVRHRFPRASTDAMITWMITRPLLAKQFPGTVLPSLGQPLGGELLLGRNAVEALASDRFVRARSDWGIDTVITHATASLGFPMYEHNVLDGKRHALYGRLDEIRAMAIECLDAAISLRDRARPSSTGLFAADPPAPAPGDLKHTVAYDVGPTIELLTEGWSPEEQGLAESFPAGLRDDVLTNVDAPSFDFMTAEVWSETLDTLGVGFVLGDAAWESLAFRLWLMRVLAYTTKEALWGYDAAIGYLEQTIRDYEKGADHHGHR